MANLKKFSVMMTEEMHSHIQQNAEKRGLTMNAVVIFALEYYFHHNEALGTMQAMLDRVEQEEQKQKEMLALTSEQKPE